MSDISELSDDQLKSLMDQHNAEGKSALSSMSDEDLQGLHQKQNATGLANVVNVLGQGENIENNPKGNMNILGREMLSGVPIAGASVPIDKDTKNFEKDHPNISQGMRVAGGTLAMIPAAAAAPELFGLAGGTGTRLLTGAGTGGSINAADTAARGGSPEDVKRSFFTGAATGAFPAAAGKVISPGLGAKGTQAVIYGGIPTTGAVIGHHLGGLEGGILGEMIGGAAAVGLKDPLKKYLKNTFMDDLVQSLLQGGKAVAPKAAPRRASTTPAAVPEAPPLGPAPFQGKINAEDLAKTLFKNRYQ